MSTSPPDLFDALTRAAEPTQGLQAAWPARSRDAISWSDVAQLLDALAPLDGYLGAREAWPAGEPPGQLALFPSPVEVLASAGLRPNDLEMLFGLGSAPTRAAVIAVTPGPALVTLGALDSDPGPRWAAAAHPRLDIEMCHRLASDRHERVRSAVAATTPDHGIQRMLATDRSESVRAAVARNASLSTPVALLLVHDDSEQVHLALARSFDPEVLASLLDRAEDDVVEGILTRDDLPQSIQIAAAEAELVDLRHILFHWDIDEEVIEAALGDELVTDELIKQLTDEEIDRDVLEWLAEAYREH